MSWVGLGYLIYAPSSSRAYSVGSNSITRPNLYFTLVFLDLPRAPAPLCGLDFLQCFQELMRDNNNNNNNNNPHTTPPARNDPTRGIPVVFSIMADLSGRLILIGLYRGKMITINDL